MVIRTVFDFFDMFPKFPELINVVGKGPSVSEYFGPYGGITIGLNTIPELMKCDVVHLIDLDVLDDLIKSLADNSLYFWMPFYPHADNIACDVPAWALNDSRINKLIEEGRVFFYNSATTNNIVGDSPIIDVKYFSAEAVVSICSNAGIEKAYLFGVDGGTDYASEVERFFSHTRLSNGRQSFDCQFPAIRQSAKNSDLLISSGGSAFDTPIFVGSTSVQGLAFRVLEFSILKHAVGVPDIVNLSDCGLVIPTPSSDRCKPRTPFSFHRLCIPSLCNYKGKALYLDSDMLVLSSIEKLLGLPIPDIDILSAEKRPGSISDEQFSVLLINCERCEWNIQEIVDALDEGELTYEQLMFEFKIASRQERSLDWNWNSLEFYREGQTRLLHYTDISSQPWLTLGNPNSYKWVEYLIDAIDQGAIEMAYLDQEITKGHVRPSLRWQVEARCADENLIPLEVKRSDGRFVPPHLTVA